MVKITNVLSDIDGRVLKEEELVHVRLTPKKGEAAYILDCTLADVKHLVDKARQVPRRGRPPVSK